MPVTSEARMNANRINAQSSTGPKTIEGKAISRQNGLTHGMTGQGIVLLAADVPEVEARAGALMAEMAPKSTLGKVLVGQLATLSVRMERSAKREEAALASRVRHSAEVFDQDRVDGAEYLFNAIADDPREHVRELRRLPEGVDRLIEAWRELRGVLTRNERPNYWEPSHQTMLAHLLGLRPEQARGTRFEALATAVQGNCPDLTDPEYVGLDYMGRRIWARDRLVERIDLEIARLEEHRATFNLETIALDRAGAADMALFDNSREGSLARRYESEARRGFFKALKEFRLAEAEVVTEPPISTPILEPEPAPIAEPLGSPGARPSPTPREPRPVPREWLEPSIGADFDVARGLDGRALAVGRAVVVPA